MSEKRLQKVEIAQTERMANMYECLTSTRRCYVIKILGETNSEAIPVRSLARQITAIEQGIRVEHATGKPYRSVYNTLVQTHLSVLDELDIVDYRADGKMVTEGEALNDALRLLRILSES